MIDFIECPMSLLIRIRFLRNWWELKCIQLSLKIPKLIFPLSHLQSLGEIISTICQTLQSSLDWILLGLRWGSGDNAGWLGWCELIVAHSWSRDRPDPRHHRGSNIITIYIRNSPNMCLIHHCQQSDWHANFVTIGTTLLKIQKFGTVNWKNFLFNLKRQNIVLI